MKFNNICCIGGDVLGRAICISIAYKCPEIRVIILDDEKTISEQDYHSYSFFGPEFVQILKKCQHRNLFFTSLYESAIKEADLIFISVRVPSRNLKERKLVMLDFNELEEAAKLVALYSESDKIVVEKTDVPVKAVEKISNILVSNAKTKFQFHILSIPSYLHEKSTIEEILEPERVVIGSHSSPGAKAAAQSLREVYEYWIPKKNVITLSYSSAGLYKQISNTFLAQKQCSVNSIMTICEETGADLSKILAVLGTDFGTAPTTELETFEENISNLIFTCDMLNLNTCAEYWECILTMNDFYMRRCFERTKAVLGSVKGQEITVWGFRGSSSKKKKSPTMLICEWLVQEKSNLRIYDHDSQSQQILKDMNLENFHESESNIQFFKDKYLSIHNSLCLVICINKEDFVDVDFAKLVQWMRRPLVIDYFRLFDEEVLSSSGIIYYTLGTEITHDKISRF